MSKLSVIVVSIGVIIFFTLLVNFYLHKNHTTPFQFLFEPNFSIDVSESPLISPPFTSHPIVPNQSDQIQSSIAFLHTKSSAFNKHAAPLESHSWAPLVIQSECIPGMPETWAPCVKARSKNKIIYSEELIFPDFIIKEPIFPSQLHRNRIITQWGCDFNGGTCDHKLKLRYYRGQTGQNLIFENVSYDGRRPPADSWGAGHCMASDTSHAPFLKDTSSSSLSLSSSSPLSKVKWSDLDSNDIYSSAVLVTTPNAWSFQHFLDRVTHLLEQSDHLVDNKTVLWNVEYTGMANVEAMYELLGYSKSRRINVQRKSGAKNFNARKLIYSCRCPLVHPYYALRAVERFNVPRFVPMEDRKKVVFLSRAGKSRSLVNEVEVLKGIRELLKRRKLDEELVMFDELKNKKFADLVQWMGSNVRAVIGAHGGAFFNHRWCGRDTLVVELMPTNRIFRGIYEEAAVLSQRYAMFGYESNHAHSITAEVDELVSFLDTQLGLVNNPKDNVLQHIPYPWKDKSLNH